MEQVGSDFASRECSLADLRWFHLGKFIPGDRPDSEDPGEGPWRFRGIASDEAPDVEGDEILRRSLDLGYAASRGFVNWNHGTDPEDQIGWLDRAELVSPRDVPRLEDDLGVALSKTATVFVEGSLYKYVKRAEAVASLLKSAPPGKGLGLSLQGEMARDPKDLRILKAFVRGVAITQVPAHPRTLVSLAKSLKGGGMQKEAGKGLSPEELREVAGLVSGSLAAELRKSLGIPEPRPLTRDEAILTVLKNRPHWTYAVAAGAVDHVMHKE